MLLDQCETVIPSVVRVFGWAAMDDDGQFGGAGQFHLTDEDSLLCISRRMIVVIVEADLAPCDHLRPARELFKFGEVGISGEFGFVGMNANCGVNHLVLL